MTAPTKQPASAATEVDGDHTRRDLLVRGDGKEHTTELIDRVLEERRRRSPHEATFDDARKKGKVWLRGGLQHNGKSIPRQVATLAGSDSPQFSSSERIVLDGEELNIKTVAEFRQMLRLVLDRSQLTCGQIATKSSIGRSSAYNLIDVNRTGLPTKRLQVEEFLCACGLQLRQVSTIMRIWAVLDAMRPRPTGRPTNASPAPAASPAPLTRLSPREIVRKVATVRGPRIRDVAVGDIGRELVRLRTLLPIFFGIAVLAGWQFLSVFLVGDHAWTVLRVSENWWFLAGLAMVMTAQMVNWQLRRLARSRPADTAATGGQARFAARPRERDAEVRAGRRD